MQKRDIQLPKDALSRITLGNAFAEYDTVLFKPGVYVVTPSIAAAQRDDRAKFFFVGRRGTGKTATANYLKHKYSSQFFQIFPMDLCPTTKIENTDLFHDTKKKGFRLLLTSFERTLVDELLSIFIKQKKISFTELDDNLTRERNLIEDFDFDVRLSSIVKENLESLRDEKKWHRGIKRTDDIIKSCEDLFNEKALKGCLIIDRIDDSWDGSDESVICLMALMHSVVRLNSMSDSLRILVFLRENIFERVRLIDNEFARLETSVISMEWTNELLVEFIERRLVQPFNTKPPLGDAWRYFFEDPEESKALIFDYCQKRPRDILTYCTYAIESAQSHKHLKISTSDINEARKSFSESRLKDLGDEYSENYPHIDSILNLFYGLSKEYTLTAIDSFIKILLIRQDIKERCSNWIFKYTSPHKFIELLFNVGFWGIKVGSITIFRSLGTRGISLPTINESTQIAIHPCYHEALGLHNHLLTNLDSDTHLKTEGLVDSLPDGFAYLDYTKTLENLLSSIDSIAKGSKDSGRWEDFIGEVLRLCFYNVFTNIQPHSRDHNGTTIKDWVVSNVAESGFWKMIKDQYQTTQIIWECKNYETLKSDDFAQCSYYMTGTMKAAMVVFRGEVTSHYYDHIKRVHDKGQLLLLLTEKDIKTFLRQKKNGKVKESHIQDIFDATIRKIG